MGKSLPPTPLITLAKWIWTTQWRVMMSKMAPSKPSGDYDRPDSQFRNEIGTAPDNPYQPDSGRYCLYIGYGCPWAHRTLVVLALKGLESVISVMLVSPSATAGGWVFAQEHEGCTTLSEFYAKAKSGYDGRSTVPVLWDTQTQTIVNNESADIIMMLNSQLNEYAQHPELDLYPEALRPAIDQWNQQIYTTVNNGVYRCGFAQSQPAYDQACEELFGTLDQIDAVLGKTRYLCGDQLTLADVRLFPTLFRFDVAYYGLFKCNRRRIQDYQNLGPYLRDLYQLPGVADTCNLDAVKQGYYGILFPLNPGAIIPAGPDLTSLLEPHGRDSIGNTVPVL